MLKMGIITGFLSKTKDRFHEYNAPLELDGKLSLMAQIDGYDGVELVYPYEVNDPKSTRDALDKLEMPQTDIERIWPWFWQHRGGFFAAHCHCVEEGRNDWRLEASRPTQSEIVNPKS